ncbi:membrane protease YdiL (CAAX protease family) [Streptomyces griseochromogenes]|uniref:Membrane protease YdiL (CAAX protease family) n=1 Tax=Streptomyces griseochromogenes TaxID=68214 RepID=A0ABS4M6X0_9ACTN|nr:CPBP family intramembrane glutamic endopeptidase [Streptomyces griseochromogenes]MBP2055126.1 membrane protease YdiL (CAAX protease family) [Streptomyces griseochromogenes]
MLGRLAWIVTRPITQGSEYPLWSLRGAVASALGDAFLFGGLLALVTWRVVHVEHRRFADLGLASPGWGRELARGYALGLAWAVAALFIAVAAGWAAVSGGVRQSALVAFTPLWMVVSVFQAGVEEVIFRGWMLSLLVRRRGPCKAVLIQALLFGCLHLLVDANTALAVLHGLVFGVFAGLHAQYRRGIWGVIGIHGAYNFAAIPIIAVSGGGRYGPAGWHYAAVALTGVGASVAYILFKRSAGHVRFPR